MSTFAAEKAYVRGIERRFIALRGSGLYLSPRDFALLLDWHERGVPAELVVASIEEVIRASSARSTARSVQSIAYCRHAIEEAWEERRKALIGAAAPYSPPTKGAITADEVVAHLEAAARALTAAGSAFQSVALKVSEMRRTVAEAPPSSFELLEDELVAIEVRSIDLARATLPPEDLESITHQAEDQIAPFTGRMSAKVRAATVRRAVDAAIRARLNVPRLSLFTIAR